VALGLAVLAMSTAFFAGCSLGDEAAEGGNSESANVLQPTQAAASTQNIETARFPTQENTPVVKAAKGRRPHRRRHHQ